MIWALLNDEKTEAIPKTFGKCPLCGKKVVSKCGEIKVWHWAHLKDKSCDHWYEPETFWHLHWKLTFGKENAEIVIKKDGKRHIADILTNSDVVIELQNSPIQKSVIRKREKFYGERMLWLINGIDFKDNFEVSNQDNFDVLYRFYNNLPANNKLVFDWKWARKSWEEVERSVFIDFGKESLFWVQTGMGTSRGEGKYISKEKFINKYGGDFEYYTQQRV
ncbi:competence protein CoiA [Psychroserpens ponticola]|uniref:Competence protein CoiA family protein n=1 Tax=Psychroserpens ponticola TaxID=2932268 RepID=A0ABY7S3D9_9FLAO|nr:competence protein CoiA family protein [Psychroserpens ponticola]WCO03515.1 competence protein CoiA family protein [Psychroserpens ponticola]